MRPNDEQRLFASAYVKCECSVESASAHLGWSTERGHDVRVQVGTRQEIERLIAESSRDVNVSRAFCLQTYLTIIDRAMDGEPVLFMGSIVQGVKRFKADAALKALKQLHDLGYVQDATAADDEPNLTDEERFDRVLRILDGGAKTGAGQAPVRAEEKTS